MMETFSGSFGLGNESCHGKITVFLGKVHSKRLTKTYQGGREIQHMCSDKSRRLSWKN